MMIMMVLRESITSLFSETSTYLHLFCICKILDLFCMVDISSHVDGNTRATGLDLLSETWWISFQIQEKKKKNPLRLTHRGRDVSTGVLITVLHLKKKMRECHASMGAQRVKAVEMHCGKAIFWTRAVGGVNHTLTSGGDMGNGRLKQQKMDPLTWLGERKSWLFSFMYMLSPSNCKKKKKL